MQPSTTLSFTKYKWRVRAFINGIWTAFNPYLEFTVSKMIPVILSPKGLIYENQPIFSWTSIPLTVEYQVQLLKGTTIIYDTVIDQGQCTSIQCDIQFGQILSYAKYNWRVRAFAKGIWNAYSPLTYFETTNPIPNLLSPVNTAYTPQPTFKWSRVRSATSYQFQVMQSDFVLFESTLASSICSSTSNVCTYKIPSWLNFGDYQWRVRALGGGKWLNYSPLKDLSVIDPVPTLISPIVDTTDPLPGFEWSQVVGATRYQLEVYKGTTLLRNPVVYSSACVSNICSYELVYSLNPGNYKWRVRADAGGGWRSYSSYKYFAILSSPG